MKVVVRDLHADALYSQPINKDWTSGAYGGFGDPEENGNWEFWEVDHCEECSGWVYNSGAGHKDSCPKVDEPLDGTEGPMMSYWYPIDDDRLDPEDAALKLGRAYLPLCVVRVDDAYGLALTGGGMDLSWEICEAFVRLGYLPPIHFCRLPAMAGLQYRHKARTIVAACRRSLFIARRHLSFTRQDLEHTVKSMKQETDRRAELAAAAHDAQAGV